MIGNENHRRTVVGLGEILWDLLPEGSRPGGAPANFAVMSSRLGDRAVVASRLGPDALGAEARTALEAFHANTDFLQTDAEYPTGTVTVSLASGEPEYTIHEPVAWDRLEFTPEWQKLAHEADAVCFGTLAQRSPASRATILEFLHATRPECVRVFDVNLRAPFWSPEVLRQSLGHTTILKLNAAELPDVLKGTEACPYPTASTDEEEVLRGARRLMDRYPLQLVCVTLGAHGSLLATPSNFHRHYGLSTTIRDTVGAGDAFTAALVHYYLDGAPLAVLNEAGNRWGSWVASQSGGIPPLTAKTLAEMNEAIELLETHLSAGHETL